MHFFQQHLLFLRSREDEVVNQGSDYDGTFILFLFSSN